MAIGPMSEDRGMSKEAASATGEGVPVSEPSWPSFRTKTGLCTITPDRLLIARDGVRGVAARLVIGNSVTRVLLLYSVLALILLAVGLLFLLTARTVEGALMCLAAALLFRAVIRSRNNTAAPEISRAHIVSVEARGPREGLTRAYFTVHYRDGTAIKKRLIMLPGSLSSGAAEYQKARQVFIDAGLLT